jgi:hypothetical protein
LVSHFRLKVNMAKQVKMAKPLGML